MTGTKRFDEVSTKLQRIAMLARKHPEWVFTTLAHVIDEDFLKEAFRRTRKNGATGVDGETAAEYEGDLQARLASLADRLKSGTYRAPPIRRVFIPKGDGTKQRPIGIPTFEDKVLQRAVTMVLEAIYEQDFLDCSYGFRPGRSAHDALKALRSEIMSMNGGWVVELDIESFFDTLEHHQLRNFLDLRVRDGVIRRAIGKWCNAGVLEAGALKYPDEGTPQGGVISPLLANIYLHEVLDKWFVREVQPRLEGRASLFRYADDAVIVLSSEADARRLLAVLPKRFGRFGLRLHPEKTRLVRFTRPPLHWSAKNGGGKPESFDFLGFTHYWARARTGGWSMKSKTAKARFTRAIKRIRAWCRENRHWSIPDQHGALVRKLRGHYGYYGITGNSRAITEFEHQTRHAWRKWLNRRSDKAGMTWALFEQLMQRLPLPTARIAHHFRPASANA